MLIFSQYHNFTSEPEAYFKDAEAYLAFVNKSDAKEFMKEFEPVWLGTELTPRAEGSGIYNFKFNV